MTSFLNDLLRKVAKPLESHKPRTVDPDEEKRAFGQRLAKLSTTLSKLCCLTCNNANPRVEMSADHSGYACQDCGEVLQANVKSEPRANYDNDPALEQAEHVRNVVDVYDYLPHLFKLRVRLTEEQQWQQLRARQTIIVVHELGEYDLLGITHDELNEAKCMLMRMFKGMKPSDLPTLQERGSPCFWAMAIVRDILARRHGGFTVATNALAAAWTYQGMHAFLAKRSVGCFYMEDSRLRTSGRLAGGVDAVNPQRLTVHGLGTAADMQRKLNCVVRLVNAGFRTHDDDTTAYLDVPHTSAPDVVPSPFAAGPSMAPAAPRVKITRRHDTKLSGIQKPRLARPERDHADFEAYMAEPDNGFLGAGYTGC